MPTVNMSEIATAIYKAAKETKEDSVTKRVAKKSSRRPRRREFTGAKADLTSELCMHACGRNVAAAKAAHKRRPCTETLEGLRSARKWASIANYWVAHEKAVRDREKPHLKGSPFKGHHVGDIKKPQPLTATQTEQQRNDDVDATQR